MLYREIIAVCSQIHTKHIIPLSVKVQPFLVSKHAVPVLLCCRTQNRPDQHWGPPNPQTVTIFFSRVKWPACEADHSHSSNSYVKHNWSYTSVPPLCLYGVDRGSLTVLYSASKFRCSPSYPVTSCLDVFCRLSTEHRTKTQCSVLNSCYCHSYSHCGLCTVCQSSHVGAFLL